jgi:phospholipid/cholesterol/gamma-HCH transport system substrate-binding protein
MRIIRRHPLEVAGVVAFTVLSLFLTTLIANTLRQTGGGDRSTFVAEFTDASGLQVGDEVRMAGVRVGRVDGRTLDGDHARITFSVASDQPMRTDTRARISYLNLLGQRYIALEPGDKPGRPMREGDVIGVDRNAPALDLTELFNAFKPLFDALDPDDVNVLAREIVDAMQGQGPVVAHLTAQTADLTTHLADRDEIFTRVIDNVAAVMRSMSDHRDEISGIINGLHDLVGGLADDRQDVDAAITSMDRLTTGVRGLLDETADPLTSSVRSMRSVGREMVTQLDELRGATRKLPTMLDAYARSMSYGSWLSIYLCHVSNAPPGPAIYTDKTGKLASEVCR